MLFVVESLPDLELRRLWKSPPPLYGTLGAESGAVLFEFPIHGHWDYFGENLPYMYFSTWHWTRMVNGYSGFVPQSYQDFTVGTAGFPLGDTVEFLQRVGVTHVGLHCALWDDDSCALTIERLAADPRFRLVTAAQWQGKPAHLYELQR